ncbi:MAG: GNAT family N-acetyltransferase [Candidatus Cloacimonetes bacterium]|nr:GNAT family N-acetyltransferase [Candidatus Cloacimonadota bacterium]MCF7814059.1 GNAT family N-acetyltransferase [Candidatus Cloacimonadota bacterium]MCF7868639.1 GNAT family N-acetyltransferase [Candidatus Cloacimonadota bacterium]MCF7884094.1 GNAT family N-acetyltransferase [Candidatus Cloacimonadota bacterium]
MKNLTIKSMNRADLDFMIDQAANEGWNPGIFDADTFYKTDPNGYFLAEINGKPVGCISLVKYDNTFAFLGFFIVIESMRGKGIGMKLWQQAINYAGNCNIGLDGVVAQQENYKKSSFKFAYNNSRYEFIKQTEIKMPDAVKNLRNFGFAEILEYDKICFPTKRKTFLKNWLKQTDSLSFGILQNNKFSGFIVIRPCRVGYKIGSLFADDFATAEKLFSAAVSQIDIGQKVYLDIPEINPEAVKFVQKNKMEKVFETARMYTGYFPKIDIDKIFGVTTFELG